MKIVIEITENYYKACKEWHKNKMATVEQSLIANGKPYEERPQGDLISRSELKKCAIPCQIHNGALTDLCVPLYQIDNAPTVETKTTADCIIAYGDGYETARRLSERPQGEWGKWVISEIRCPNCLEYFQTDCYSTEELKKCPNCGADMRGEE